MGAWRRSGDGSSGRVGMLAACSLGAAAKAAVGKAAMVEGEEGGWWQGQALGIKDEGSKNEVKSA